MQGGKRVLMVISLKAIDKGSDKLNVGNTYLMHFGSWFRKELMNLATPLYSQLKAAY